MKKIISILLVALMLLALSVSAFAAAGDITIRYSLTADGQSQVTAKKGDVIKVSYQISASADAATITTQNEILYDHNFFELVPGSVKLSSEFSGWYATSTPVSGSGEHFVFFNSSDSLTYQTDAAEIGTFELKVIARSGASTVRSTNYFANDAGLNRFGAAVSNLTVTVEGGTSGGEGGTGGGGVIGGDQKESGEGETIEMSAGSDAAKIEVTVSEGTAEVTVDQTELTNFIAETAGKETTDKKVTIDLSSKEEVTAVALKTDVVKQISEAAVDSKSTVTGLEVKMSEATVSIDATALEAIADQAAGSDIKMEVVVGDRELTSAQKETIGDLENTLVISANIFSGSKKVTDFNGGSVSLEVPYTWSGKGVVRAAYIADDGTVEIVPVVMKNGVAVITVKHFSKYVLYTDETAVSPFVDVKTGDYFYDAVLWAAGSGITSGVDATHFNPSGLTTRGQTVTFLWRAAGCPEPTATTCPFTDVKADAYYYKAVLWAVEKGITDGTSATTFAPNATVSRGQTVTFLWRYEGRKTVGGSNSFADVAETAYYYEAVLWAKANGITGGVSATSFAPNATCTRAQVVSFLYRDIVK